MFLDQHRTVSSLPVADESSRRNNDRSTRAFKRLSTGLKSTTVRT
jgi:hypothetical protein